MTEDQLRANDRRAALEEMYAILADEAYSRDHDPDVPFVPTDRRGYSASLTTDLTGS